MNYQSLKNNMMNKTNKIIYLDNAAALKVDKRVIDYFNEQIFKCYFNQEAIHSAAYNLRSEITTAEDKLSSFFTNKKKSLKALWGDSGTSVINAFFRSPFFEGGNIVSTNMEHASISETIKRCKNSELRIWKNSFKVSSKQKNSAELFDIKELENLIDKDSKALVLHHIHSELGYIENLNKISSAVKKINPHTLIIVDGIQSVGKIPIDKELFDNNLIDAITVSGYKTGSFGGAAIIYRDINSELFSEFFKNMRNKDHAISRANPTEVLTLVKSVDILYNEMVENYKHVTLLRDYVYNELKNIVLFNNRKIKFLIPIENCSPYIFYFILPEIQGAVIVRMLAMENIFISSGSACEAETNEVSKTLQNLEVSKDLAYGALRISFSSRTSLNDVEIFVEKFKNILKNY